MIKSPKARIEIEAAYKSIDEMENAKTLEDFQQSWNAFLNQISRAWDKTRNSFIEYKDWNKISTRYGKIRKDDPLLEYLRIARNFEYHRVDDITHHQPRTTTITATTSEPEPCTINPDGSVVIPARELLRIRLYGPRVKLIPLEDREKTHFPPRMHRGEEIDPDDVIGLAKKAAEFYKEVLDAAEHEVFK